MFVLMNLMSYCLQRVCVLSFGVHRSSAPVKRTRKAIRSIASLTLNPIAPLHAPIPRLNT
jgi:hypothetical protein